MTENFDIATLETMDAAEIFVSGGVDPIVAAVEAEVAAFVPDLTTDKGRKAVASLANNVAKVKVRLDDAGKDLVSGWKEKAKKVDVVRKDLRDRLDSLKAEARKPLTEWEEEQERIKEEERKLAEIELAHMEAMHMNQLFDQQREQDRIAEEQRKQQEELDRQKAEIEAQKQKLIDEENERIAEADRIKREEQERIEAEERRKREEAEAVEREKQRKVEEEKRIEAARLQAIEDEKKRVEAEEERKRVEQEKREENKRIRTRVHNHAVVAIVNIVGADILKDQKAHDIVNAIAAGKIPKVSITY